MGWLLRPTPGQVRNASTMRPIPRVGVRAGSKTGISARRVSTQSAGTGGSIQPAGSLSCPEKLGIIRVPSGVSTSISAWIALSTPPTVQPMRFGAECTSSAMPASTPSARRSRPSVARVLGSGVRAMLAASTERSLTSRASFLVALPPWRDHNRTRTGMPALRK